MPQIHEGFPTPIIRELLSFWDVFAYGAITLFGATFQELWLPIAEFNERPYTTSPFA